MIRPELVPGQWLRPGDPLTPAQVERFTALRDKAARAVERIDVMSSLGRAERRRRGERRSPEQLAQLRARTAADVEFYTEMLSRADADPDDDR